MTLPFNLAAERTVIANILYEPSLFERAAGLVPEQFYDAFHALVWRTILETRKDGGTCTAEYVETCLRGNDLFERHREYYLSLSDGEIYFGSEVEMNAQVIRDMAIRRDIIRVAEQMKSSAMGAGDGYIDPSLLLADIEAEFAKVSKGAGSRDKWEDLNHAASGVVASVIASLKDGKPRGQSTGIKRLDKFMGGMRAGDMIVIAGASSMGKTSFSRNLAYTVAANGGHVAFFSLEMTAEQIAARTLSAEARRLGFARVPYRDMDNASISHSDLKRLEEASARITDRLVVDDTSAISATEMRLRCRAAERKAGKLDLIVVDYLQIMDLPQSRGETRTNAIGRATAALKAMAKEFACPVIVLSQLSREYFKREGKRPQLVDLRESGSIEQDADKVMFVHREAYFIERTEPAWSDVNAHNEWRAELSAVENRLEVIVAKNRMGRVGTVELWIDQACDLVLSEASDAVSLETNLFEGAK